MKPRPTLLFYCQHAMGMGHLVRSLALADALRKRFRVVLLNGGVLPLELRVPDGLELINLPPLALAEGGLVSHDGRAVEQLKTERRQLILHTLKSLRPEVLLIELFPFGRKKFKFELLPLLDKARNQNNRPLVVCSLRDILVNRKSSQASFEKQAIEIANRYFDAILVHADPTFVRLEESLGASDLLTPSVHYTGFVTANRSDQTTTTQRGPILISAGGGSYGAPLFKTVMAAAGLRPKFSHPEMKIVAGPLLSGDEWEALHSSASRLPAIQVVRSVPDLFLELRRASASISQCGYNTALELIQANVPALVVPFADRGEDEQVKRARRLERLGAVRVLNQNDLTPERMAQEICELLTFQPRSVELNLNGAQHSVDIVEALAHASLVQVA